MQFLFMNLHTYHSKKKTGHFILSITKKTDADVLVEQTRTKRQEALISK